MLKHTSKIAIVVLLLASASAAYAQNVLTPTDVLEAEQFSVTARGQVEKGDGTLVLAPAINLDADLDLLQYGCVFEAGVGLGMGFEIEAALPYVIHGEWEAGIGNIEYSQEVSGIGDLEVLGIYRLIKEDERKPQVIVGAFVIAPTGGDEEGEPEIKIGTTTVQEGEDADAGESVWRYGPGAGISKRFENVEPYFIANYIIGGEREENDVDEDRADVASFMLGSEFHVSPQATIDVRGIFQHIGEDVKEEAMVEVKEETHFAYGGQASLYMSLGPRFTLIVGGGVMFVEDHEINDVDQTQFEDVILYSGHVGLQFVFGRDVELREPR